MKKEEEVGQALARRRLTLAVAESCTGGLIASRITDVPGASDYFLAGFVTYANSAKETILAVSPEIIAKKGAVSEEAAQAMAQGARKAAQSDLGLAVTGIAGPGGATQEKPVGLVYIALAAQEGAWVRRFQFHGDRLRIKEQSAEGALGFLAEYLDGRVS
jgi:PncC family amidohydrolase